MTPYLQSLLYSTIQALILQALFDSEFHLRGEPTGTRVNGKAKGKYRE